MKFKKFLMTLACMVLVVCATFGFVGCAKNVSAEDVKTFMAQAEIADAFTGGYKMKMNMAMGNVSEEMEAEAVFDGETLVAAHCKSEEGEVWLVDGTVYLDANNTKSTFTLAAAPTKVQNILNGLKDETDQYVSEDELNEMIDQYNSDAYAQAGIKVNFKQEGSGKNVTFTMNVSGKYNGIEVKVKGTLVFKNNKLTKVTMNSTGFMTMDMYVETFNGQITAPAGFED